MKRVMVIMSILTMLFTAGCATGLKNTTVIGKHYVPFAETEDGYGEMHAFHYSPERYIISVRGFNDEGLSRIANFSVDSNTWANAVIGSTYVEE